MNNSRRGSHVVYLDPDAGGDCGFVLLRDGKSWARVDEVVYSEVLYMSEGEAWAAIDASPFSRAARALRASTVGVV
jgi:hypothetical protein